MKIVNADTTPYRSAHMALRWAVFVEEQHVPMTLEIDARDHNPHVTHLSLIDDTDTTIGTVRLIPDTPTHYHLGRLAIASTHRKQGLGERLVRAVHDNVQKRTPHGEYATITLDAQTHARHFYEKLGYQPISDATFMDAGIEHIEMSIVLPGHATG